MRSTLQIAACLFSAIALGHAQEPSAKLPTSTNPPLKTLDEQAAYAIGLDLGNEVLASAPDVDPAIVARGLIDAMKKARPLLTPEQASEVMSRFMAKKLGPGAEKNLKDGQDFLATNKAKPGVQTFSKQTLPERSASWSGISAPRRRR